ncbi:glutamate--tRNA ligase, partial [Pseudomonadota bacterium]|nr:glutamate--tRNA ligase [Pseudomonadota bacterium]
DSEYISLALKLLPKDPFNENTWSIWTNLLKIESGKKGKDLYKPLRLCLTGQDNGPEMANLISMMGRDKVIERLSINT